MREDGCMYDCESEEEFNQESALFKKKSDEMEKASKRNKKKSLKIYQIFRQAQRRVVKRQDV